MNDTQQTQKPIQEQTIVQFPTSQSNATGFQKELEPMPSLQTHTEVASETAFHAVENQVELEPDVEKIGVKLVPTAPQISIDEKNLGVALAKEAAKIEKSPGIQLKVSMTKPQAQQITKGQLLLKNTSNPILWLAMLVLRQFQIAERNEEK